MAENNKTETKDWTGNNNSVFSTIGASNHSSNQREQHDYYATSPYSIDSLLKVHPIPPGTKILEPCCGGGHLSERLISFGYDVISEDLYDHGYDKAVTQKDFLKRSEMPDECGTIITNFPYSQALEMTLHALDILPDGGKLISFLKTTFLEGTKRFDKLFSKYPPKEILQFVKRIPCGKNGVFDNSTGSAVSYAWFVWVKGYTDDPIVKWIR